NEEYEEHYQTILDQLKKATPLTDTQSFMAAAQWNTELDMQARKLVLQEMREEIAAYNSLNK
ncbi:MAG: hypothetical protein RSB36_08070, partial [Hydrogenoanaerobacterium sp.]